MKVERTGKYIKVTSPYSTSFARKARDIGGTWSNPFWVFPIENEDLVKQLCTDCYGEWDTPLDPAELVTVEIDLDDFDGDESKSNSEIQFAGRVLAKRWTRDQKIKLDQTVAIVKGGFPSGAGSSKYPATGEEEGTVLRVLRIPRSKTVGVAGVRIIEKNTVNYEALREERKRLAERIEKIDEILATEGK